MLQPHSKWDTSINRVSGQSDMPFRNACGRRSSVSNSHVAPPREIVMLDLFSCLAWWTGAFAYLHLFSTRAIKWNWKINLRVFGTVSQYNQEALISGTQNAFIAFKVDTAEGKIDVHNCKHSATKHFTDSIQFLWIFYGFWCFGLCFVSLFFHFSSLSLQRSWTLKKKQTRAKLSSLMLIQSSLWWLKT